MLNTSTPTAESWLALPVGARALHRKQERLEVAAAERSQGLGGSGSDHSVSAMRGLLAHRLAQEDT
jgi:hypothetical protein